ncbi:MAG: hypothetical protein GX594_16445 [Pirellulaceae bacterium]|nr:hypothetical protein [Pirellulaceae bacterium]
MNNLSQYTAMNKDVLAVFPLGDESEDRGYWHSKTPRERLAAVEYLRVLNYGYDPASSRLQRVLEVAQLRAD